MKSKLILLGLFWLLPLGAAAQSGDEIANKALAARGGIDKIRALRSQRVTGTISFAPGADGAFTVELQRPGKMHMEIILRGQTIVRVYDGQSAGWMINPFEEKKDAQPMSGADLANVADEADFDGPLVDYKEKGNQIAYAGPGNVEGKPVYRLKLTRKNGDVRVYSFDASSYLLLKWEGVRKTSGNEIPVESFFRDYRDVQGLKFAFQIDSDSPGSQQTQQIIVNKLELNVPIEAARFAKPTTPPAPAPSRPQI